MQNFDHDIGFLRKMPIFSQKLSKIAENCDHNIDPGFLDFNFNNKVNPTTAALISNLYKNSQFFSPYLLAKIFLEIGP
jgi:hypothetical protein